MAVPTTTLSDRYDCDNSNQAFPITFVYLDSGNIAVQLYDSSVGTFETLVEDTGYTVSNDTVTTVATYAAEYDIIIQLDPDLTQLTDWVNNDKFTSDSWENAVDKLTLITKMLQDQIDRCVRGPDGDASLDWKLSEGAVDRAGNYLHFNQFTGAIETVSSLTPSTATVTTFVETLLDDTSISAFLSTLEFTSLAQTLVADATEVAARATLDAPQTPRAYTASNADYTSPDSARNEIIDVITGGSDRTITLPAIANSDGAVITIRKIDSGAGDVVIDGVGSEEIGYTGATNFTLNGQDQWVTLQAGVSKWAVIASNGQELKTTDSVDRTETGPTASTWYNTGTISLTLTPGIWDLGYYVVFEINDSGDIIGGQVTLSTANNSESDSELTTEVKDYAAGAARNTHNSMMRSKRVRLSANTTYYLNGLTNVASLTNFIFLNSSIPALIRARRVG